MLSNMFVYDDYNNRNRQSRHLMACIMIPVCCISYMSDSGIKRQDKDSVALSFSQLFRQKRALLASCGCTGG